MRSVGLITEYNPFHNGHLHHLRQSVEVASADVAVAVMSGHFLQRGEPALLDKWCRTAMALAAGVDLVVELPLPWACNSAPVFAAGGIAALAAIGVDALSFGSEAGDLGVLQDAAGLIESNAEFIATETGKRLRQGENYPQARAEVVRVIADDSSIIEVLLQPNNILGIEYLRALGSSKSSIVPHTIPRIGAGFHDVDAVADIASATGIRRMIAAGERVDAFMPESTFSLLHEAWAGGRTPDEEVLFRLLIQALQQKPKSLRRLYQVADGIENRFYKVAQTADSYQALIDAGKSRHLTRTRVQRLLVYILLSLEAGVMAEFLDCGPLYLHLLGQRCKGDALLAARRKETDMPLIGNYSRIRSVLTHHYGKGSEKLRLAQEMLAWELKATRIYTLMLKNWPGGNRNLDFFKEVIRPT